MTERRRLIARLLSAFSYTLGMVMLYSFGFLLRSWVKGAAFIPIILMLIILGIAAWDVWRSDEKMRYLVPILREYEAWRKELGDPEVRRTKRRPLSADARLRRWVIFLFVIALLCVWAYEVKDDPLPSLFNHHHVDWWNLSLAILAPGIATYNHLRKRERMFLPEEAQMVSEESDIEKLCE